MEKTSDLTEETAEIKSSDGKQLGVVSKIVLEDIAMDCYIGKRGIFVLPRDMIADIRRKTVYLNITKKEFEAWWKKEGSLQIAEYPARLEVALGRKLVGEDLDLLREDVETAFENTFRSDVVTACLKGNRCPYCGSFIYGNERFFCSSCGLYFMKDEKGNYEIPTEQRDHLVDEQESIRQTFSSRVRNLLHFDEWVYHSVNFYQKRPLYLSIEEDVVVVTSKRLIRFKSDGGKEDNWEIPVSQVISVSSFIEQRIDWMRAGYRYGPGTVLYMIFRFTFQSDKGLKYKRMEMLNEEYTRYAIPEEAESIGEFVDKAREARKTRLEH
ncbi:MAG: hypothetical protein ACFFBS_10330 [Promethearchaeota archaeon]